MTGNNPPRGLLALAAAILLVGRSASAQAPVKPPVPATIGPPPQIHLDFGHFSGSFDHAVIDQARITVGGELTVQADRVEGDLLRQRYAAIGNVRAHEQDTTLTADSIRFDGLQNFGTGAHTLLAQKPYTLRASRIEVTPTSIIARGADLTTAPPDVSPDYNIRAGTLSLFPQRHRGEMRNASFYLFHTRLITLRKVSFPIPGGAESAARRQFLRPVLGYSGRTGPYVTLSNRLQRPLAADYSVTLSTRFALQARLAADQVLWRQRGTPTQAPPPSSGPHDYLGAIRALATAARPPLPEGDPLLFHDFLPDPNPIRLFDAPERGRLTLAEEVALRQEGSGNRHDNLYVTRLPELRLYGILPLTPVSPMPAPGDAAAFRRYLRRVVVYVGAEAGYGVFHEDPTAITHSRQRDSVGLFLRPLLIAPDTVLFPRASFTFNAYPGRAETYRYTQLAVALNHYWSDRAAVGLQYIDSRPTGGSPFNFDVLDTTQELDARLQLGDRRLTLAGLVRYDVIRHETFDYKLSIAPGLRGFTPVFSYNFRSRSFGLGLEIEGLTF